MTTYFSETELAARKLLEDYRTAHPWNPDFNAVAAVFKAMYYAALTTEKVNAIACALCGFTGFDAQEELTRLTRAKVLRSRMHGGERLYELNY